MLLFFIKNDYFKYLEKTSFYNEKPIAKSLVSQDKEKLIGNSGCKLNIFKDKIFKVRKQSSNFFEFKTSK